MSAWRTASRDTLRRAVLLGGEVGHVGDHVPRPRHRVGRRLDEGSVGGQPTQLGGVAEEHLPRWHGPSFQRLPRRRSILRSRRRVTTVSAQPTCPGPLRPGGPTSKAARRIARYTHPLPTHFNECAATTASPDASNLPRATHFLSSERHACYQ